MLVLGVWQFSGIAFKIFSDVFFCKSQLISWGINELVTVAQMAVIPFDSPYLKTPCCTQTSWLYLLQNHSYWYSFCAFLAPVTLALNQRPAYTNLTWHPLKMYLQTENKLSTSRLLEVIRLHTDTQNKLVSLDATPSRLLCLIMTLTFDLWPWS